jgi:hypothetical protein
MRAGPYIGTLMTASLTDEEALKIGQAHIIEPLVAADLEWISIASA